MTASPLIDKLCAEPLAQPLLPRPVVQLTRLLLILALYTLGVLPLMGVRADLADQMLTPPFLAEIFLLSALLISSMLNAVWASYPDYYQRQSWQKVPLIISLGLIAFYAWQWSLSSQSSQLMPMWQHMECTICLLALACLPTMMMLFLARRGAVIYCGRAGCFCVLTAVSMACLILRFSEQTDNIPHMLVAHYLPALCVTLFGALIGRALLRW